MGKRFDDLSKAFASGVSRRQALVGALGGVGAAVAAAVIPGRGTALADSDAALKCCPVVNGQPSGFCATHCRQQALAVNGGATYVQYCIDQCCAEAAMGQGACFSENGAPLYRLGCHSNSQCRSNQVCCNSRCCKPELCFSLLPSRYFNPNYFTNGLDLYFFDATTIETANICLGCPKSV
jgi:hypothetical protein